MKPLYNHEVHDLLMTILYLHKKNIIGDIIESTATGNKKTYNLLTQVSKKLVTTLPSIGGSVAVYTTFARTRVTISTPESVVLINMEINKIIKIAFKTKYIWNFMRK